MPTHGLQEKIAEKRAVIFNHVVKHSRMVLDTHNATKDVVAGREKIKKA